MASRLKRSKRAEYRSRLRDKILDDAPLPKVKRGGFVSKKREEWNVNGVLVSDHAVVRYMQHVLGFDIQRIRAAIVGGERARLIMELRTTKCPIGDGCKVVARDGLVVTVVRPKKDYERAKER